MSKGAELAKRGAQAGVPVRHESGLAEPAYEELRERCAEIMVQAEQSFLQSMWLLGQAVIESLGEDHPEYGAHVVHRLSGDLGVDHTHIYRAVQLYEIYPKAKIFDTRATIHALSWRKVRMLLPLDPALRAEMEKRLASGEIRTDEQLRLAIYERRVELGQLDLAFTRPEHFGVKGIDLEKARTLLRKAGPDAQLSFGLLGSWAEDWARYYIRPDAPEERRLVFKERCRDLGQRLMRMSEEA